jgi:hypothetical protein
MGKTRQGRTNRTQSFFSGHISGSECVMCYDDWGQGCLELVGAVEGVNSRTDKTRHNMTHSYGVFQSN